MAHLEAVLASMLSPQCQEGRADVCVLFEPGCAIFERRSMLITANKPFGELKKAFPDPAMTLAAAGRLIHHAAIFELNIESYRRRG